MPGRWRNAHHYHAPIEGDWWLLCDETGRRASERRYQAGCRCDPCREAHRLYRRDGTTNGFPGAPSWSERIDEPIRTIDNPYGHP